MAAFSSLPFCVTKTPVQAQECRNAVPTGLAPWSAQGQSGGEGLKWRLGFDMEQFVSVSCISCPPPRHRACVLAVAAVSAFDVPPVSETKATFLKAYRKPIPSIYSNVIQELLVLQHIMRYNRTYQYDAVFALGFVTVYDQLMDGYPSDEDREAIFKAYISALREDPEEYRRDAQKLEKWAISQTAESIVSFASREGEVENLLKDIAERAKGKVNFHYSRFFAIGLFRILEVAKASDPTVLEQLSNALNISKRSVDRDLDVYRNLLSKLAQAKDLMKEYIDREKKKQAEREASSKNDGAAIANVEAK